ncbi:MAG: NAD(P)/FAD-dependent oxidoreductase [Myxococcota bacterium]
MSRIIVVGAGVAGARAAEAIAVRSPLRVVVVGAEPECPYQRPLVSKELLLGQRLSDDETWLVTLERWQALGIELRAGTSAVALRPEAQALVLSDGEVMHFERLVVATGSTPRRLPVPGAALPGVFTLRSMRDGQALAPRLSTGRRVVVIGGGPLGLEIAEAARARGALVTVVERGESLLARMVGPLLAPRLAEWLPLEGLTLRLGAGVRRVVGVEVAQGVELTSGEVLEADTVVMAVGVEPATGWLEGSGLLLERGAVRVDEHGQSSHPRVFAAGEVAAAWSPRLQRHLRVEHFGWAWQHGEVVGQNVAGGAVPFTASPGAGVTLQGHRLQVAGDVEGAVGCVIAPAGHGGRLAVLERDAQVSGVVAVDAPREFARARAELGRPLTLLADWVRAA